MPSIPHRTLLAALAGTCLTGLARAQPVDENTAIALPDVTVSAARVPLPRTDTGSSVTIIPGEQIELEQRRTLPDLLNEVPGLDVVRTGGPGSQTSVFMRGANANQVKVRLDGMEINDPSSPTGAFDFGPFLTYGNVGRLEVLRGPQSGLYGADAIGGVIDITTPKGEGPPHVTGSLEGGSFGTFNQSGSISGSIGPFSYFLNISHVRSTDTPTVPAALIPPGQRINGDSFDNTTVTTRLGYQVTENFDLNFTGRLSTSDLRFTGDDESVFPSVPASALSDSQQRTGVGRITAHLVSFGGVLQQTVGAGYVDYRRRDQAPPFDGIPSDPSYDRGDRFKLDWRGDVRLGGFGTFILGAEHILEEIRNSPISAATRTDAGYAEIVAKYGRFSGTANVRFDSNSRFGDYATWRVAPAIAVPETGTVFKASAGTGFKGPTLDQLFVSYPSFGFFANPNLKAEQSFGFDAGAEQAIGSRVRVGATYFHSNINNLIDTSADGTTYANVARATTNGAEAFAAWQVTSGLNVRLNYTNTTAVDDVLHEELLRRPRTKIAVITGWQVTDRLFLNTTELYESSRIDGNRNFTVPRFRADGFFTANLAAEYKVTSNLAVFARVDNLLNRTYEDPSGYLQPGIGAFGGVRFGL